MHRNAALTVEERDGSAGGSNRTASRSPRRPRRCTSRLDRLEVVEPLPGRRPHRLEDRPCRPHTSPAQTRARLSSAASWRRASPASSDRPDSARSSACRPRPCTACSCVTAAAVSPIWIGPRAGRPPDPYRPCQRARSPRREVARQDPAGRGLTGAREGPLSPLPGRLRRHPLGDRRLLPAPLLRDPRRRAGGHRDRMRRSMRETRSCCSSARSLPTTR